ncbi:MAG: TIR-like domain-containing protein [Rhodothermaceae bacterium]|nr:TIR-like domain-containing protein [Rhodothermaceae bacterium]MBC13124.1 TIR-like domain-containing protein [Rhodothermaceae bacterium]|tara:strand:+ start:425 stop:985 length:561 start_codon:yes stop_codon:yes gene_type:complete
MARRVFYSFHYQADIFRVNVVRMSGEFEKESRTHFDASLWERSKSQSTAYLRKLIDEGLSGTSVTAFLLGSDTANRRWVKYELLRSLAKGNGLLSIHIHRVPVPSTGFGTSATAAKGENILDRYYVEVGGRRHRLSDMFSTYDWNADAGHANVGRWVENAKQQADRYIPRGATLLDAYGRAVTLTQ